MFAPFSHELKFCCPGSSVPDGGEVLQGDKTRIPLNLGQDFLLTDLGL